MFFRVVCSEGGQDPHEKNARKCLKSLVFSGILFVALKGFASVTSRGGESKNLRFENTLLSFAVLVGPFGLFSFFGPFGRFAPLPAGAPRLTV